MASESEASTKHMLYNGGTYSTPDERGHIEFNVETKEWDAWRDDIEGITANCESFEEAVQFAWYGQGEVQYDAEGQYTGIQSHD